MVTTALDVARVAGVSRTTVIRALKNRSDISVATKLRIKKIAAEMKYRPSYIGRSLCMGSTKLIAIFVSPTVFRAFPLIAMAAQRPVAESGYGLLCYSSLDNTPEMEASSLDHMMRSRVEGVVAAPGPYAPTEAYAEMVASGTKLVVFDSYIEGLQVPHVGADQYKVGRLAIEHLVSIGRKNIVYLAIPPTQPIATERMQGVLDAMREAGLPVTADTIIETGPSEEDAALKTTEALKRPNPPDAIFARHDVVAYGAMRAILEAGLSIPEDVALVGVGNLPDDDILAAPLTSIDLPGRECTEIAVEKLLSMLNGHPVKPDRTILDVQLIVRESTIGRHPSAK